MCPKARPCHGTSQAEGSAQDAEVSRAQKVCWAIWGVSQHRARAPHATAAGGLRVIWPGCVAVRSKGPRSAEHAYICDVRRTAKVEWTCGTEHVYRQLDRLHGTVVLTYDSVLSHVGYARAFWCHGCTCSKEGTVCDRAPRLTTLSMRTRQLRRRYGGSVCSPSPG